MDQAPSAEEVSKDEEKKESSSSEGSESETDSESSDSHSMTIGYSDPLEFFKKTDDVLTFYIMIQMELCESRTLDHYLKDRNKVNGPIDRK